jgi:hypothetical protein
MTEPQSQSKHNRFILTGNNSYIPWLENLENKQSIMDWSAESENSTITYPDEYDEATTSATQKTLLKKKVVEFKTYILESIDPSKIKVVMKNPIRKILADLARNYGTSNIDASNFKIKLPGKMFFDPLKNPLTTFRWLQNQNSILRSAGTPLTDAEFKICVEIGLEPPETTASSNSYFWFNIYSKIKESEVLSPDELEVMVIKFWKLYQSAVIVERESMNTEAKEPSRPSKNHNANNSNYANNAYSRFCKTCSENGREKVMRTHDLNSCFFKDFHGKGFPPKGERQKMKKSANVAESGVSNESFQALVALVQELANKQSQNYFHDSGATPTSFVNHKPSAFVPLQGHVGTAGNDGHKSLGHGTIQFGDLKLNATYVPSFSKNLVSGIAINNAGYHQTIGSDLLVVTKGPPNRNATVVATGKLNKNVGLFQMDHRINGSALPLVLKNQFDALSANNECVDEEEAKNEVEKTNASPSTWMQIHRSLGHCSDQLMRKTLPHVNIPKKEICKCCMEGKATRNHIPQGSRPRQILETISLDIQGPFRIKNDEGSNLNVKFVDKASRYIKMEWLPDKEGRTITTSLKGFIERMERRTGKKIQAVQTDNEKMQID